MKKIYTLLSALAACFALANAEIYSGSCGENLTWSLDSETKTLIIEGYGMMTSTPWRNNSYNYSSNVANVQLPEGLENIPDNGFNGCRALTSISIPNSVTSIGTKAFYYCFNMKKITIGKGVSNIGKNAFSECRVLNTINWNAKECADFNTSTLPFTNMNGATNNPVSKFNFGDSVEYIPAYLCNYMVNITSVKIPETVIGIGENAFIGCTNLSSVEWKAVRCSDFTMTSSPFYDIRNQIGSFAIGENVKYIPAYLCYGVSRPTTIALNSGLKKIGTYAFSNCSGLRKIDIPQNVTEIGSSAFSYCNNVGVVNVYAENPPIITSLGLSSTIPIYVPCGTLRTYNGTTWNNYSLQYEPSLYTTDVSADDSAEGSAIIEDNCVSTSIISATPNYGYHFVQWSDGNTENPRSIELTQDTIIKAIFAKNIYSLTIECDSTKGRIEGSSGEYVYLTEYICHAIPNNGYHFDHWSITQLEENGTLSTIEAQKNPDTLTIKGNTTITAFFAVNQNNLCVEVENASVKASITSSFDEIEIQDCRLVDYGSSISVTIIPNSGFAFKRWTDGNIENPRVVEITEDISLKAECENIQAILSVKSSNDEMGNAYGSGTFIRNMSTQIFAIPNDGYRFLNWSDGNVENPRLILLDEPEITIVAYFEALAISKYSVDVTALDPTKGYAEYEDYVKIEAFPYIGSKFVCWSDGNTDNPRYIELNKNINLQAIFTESVESIENSNLPEVSNTSKKIEKGIIVISTGEKSYTIQGQEVK